VTAFLLFGFPKGFQVFKVDGTIDGVF
jgi:hypothetical protein